MRITFIAMALLAASCFRPSYHNGNLRCGASSGQCPDGYHCAADSTCWTNGQDPIGNADLGGGGTGTDANGAACTSDGTCSSGHCSDGVCCDSACTGQCEACDTSGSPGTCAAVSGPTHGSRTPCGGFGDTCGGTCNGATRTSCAYPPSSTICGAACDGHCDGNGACSSTAGGMCPNGFACGAGMCRTTCNSPSDCQTNFNCTAGMCLRIAESDCLDGLDNNGDGLIDCADPTCNNVTVVCVPSVATPVGGVAASCSAGVSGTHINQGLQVPTTCHACSATANGTCSFAIYGDSTGTGCGSPNTLVGTLSSSSTCPSLATPTQYFSFQTAGTANATCTQQQTGVPDAATFSTSKNFCPSAKSPSAAACVASQVCVPKPAVGTTMCTLVNGTTCPAGYPTASGSWYPDALGSDSRSCSCSGSSVTSNGTCSAGGLAYLVHTQYGSADAACVDNPGTYSYCSGGCCSWNTAGTSNDGYWDHLFSVDSMLLHTLPPNVGASCSNGTGTVSGGTATPGAVMTVCCQ